MEGVAVIVGVFSRPEQEEKCQNDHIGSGLKRGIDKVGRCGDGDAPDDRDGNGFHSKWGGVLLFPRPESTLDAKVDLESRVEARVFGPHIEERLCNVPYVIFSRSRLDGIPAGRKFARMYSSGKDL
jgi:hypothetical protein